MTALNAATPYIGAACMIVVGLFSLAGAVDMVSARSRVPDYHWCEECTARLSVFLGIAVGCIAVAAWMLR